jgi:fatty-acyl-CoA synthase
MTSSDTKQSNTSNLYVGPAVGDMIITLLERYPERIAFIDPCGSEITYRQLGQRIAYLIEQFEHLGLERGASIVQLCGNRADVFAVMAACYIAGYRSVALHPSGGIDDQRFILESCQARLLIVDAERLERSLNLLSDSQLNFSVLAHDAGQSVRWIWDQFTSGQSHRLVNRAAADEVVRLIYTGGTTGRAKGVMGSSESLATNALIRMAAHNWTDLKLLCSTPLSHSAGTLILPVLWHGGTLVLHAGFELDRLIAELIEQRVNALYLVPTMIYRLLDHHRVHEISGTKLKMLMYGSAPISPARLSQARSVFGQVLIQHYGMSEAPTVVLGMNENDHLDDSLMASAGKPYPGVTVKILDNDGLEVKVGEVGEICIRGPLVMKGYLNEPQLTAQAFKHGWFYSGDLAYQNERGYFFIVDRSKDMIISGGFNIYPKEIENIIAEHSAVASVGVIGVPDADWGEAVRAFVVLKPNESIAASALIEMVRKAKGSIHAPKMIIFVDSLPLTALGKVDKKALRSEFWASNTRGIN